MPPSRMPGDPHLRTRFYANFKTSFVSSGIYPCALLKMGKAKPFKMKARADEVQEAIGYSDEHWHRFYVGVQTYPASHPHLL